MVNWGIVSTAWIAGLVAPCIAQVEGARLLAIASRDLDKAQRFATDHGACRVHKTYESLLNDPDISVVYLPLPNGMHAEWTRRALRAGKHVLCEKPLALNSAEAAELFALADSKGLVLMEAFMYRHHPQVPAVVKAVNAGRIGRVQSVYSSFFTRAGNATTNIRYNRALGGGALWDVGSYCVNLSALLCGGDLIAASGRARMGSGDVDVSFFGQLTFSNDHVAQFACGIEAELRTEVTVIGSEKTLTVPNPWLPDVPADIWHAERPDPGYSLSRAAATEKTSISGQNPYALQIENMVSAVTGASTPLVGRNETISTIRIIEALRRSAGLGQN